MARKNANLYILQFWCLRQWWQECTYGEKKIMYSFLNIPRVTSTRATIKIFEILYTIAMHNCNSIAWITHTLKNHNQLHVSHTFTAQSIRCVTLCIEYSICASCAHCAVVNILRIVCFLHILHLVPTVRFVQIFNIVHIVRFTMYCT